MKTSLTKLSSSFLIFSLSFGVFAKPVAQVVEVSGTVFVVDAQGKTSALKVNQHLEDKSEVMVEEGGTITLNDYFDSTYHLIGGSHLKFFNKSVQLKKGKTWVQSASTRHPLALTTANGHVDFFKSEFIATFDQFTNRTQVLVVTGDVEVSNILDKNMKYTVSAGTFTLVDPDVENGLPRSPTRVGLQSLNTALAEFKQLPKQLLETAAPVRTIASVEAEKLPSPGVKRGEIIFITTHRKPASVAPGIVQKYFKKIVTKKSDANPVPIKIYGIAIDQPEVEIAPRTPASVQVIAPSVPKIAIPLPTNDPEFSESLKKHELDQPKYPKDLQNLIDDLKSY
jgi:hypothetical protein